MKLDLDNYSIKLKAEFHFDATKKELPYFARFTIDIAKKRLVRIDSQRFLMVVRNEQDQPELELYSTNNLDKPLKSFKEISNRGAMSGSIKLDDHSIYVLNFTRRALLKGLTVIDIRSGERQCVQLNVELFSMATNFVSHGIEINVVNKNYS